MTGNAKNALMTAAITVTTAILAQIVTTPLASLNPESAPVVQTKGAIFAQVITRNVLYADMPAMELTAQEGVKNVKTSTAKPAN